MGVVFLLGVVIYAGFPLFGKGFIPTHDGEYHIIRFWQFFNMLSSGYLFPRWAPDLNSGYGIPLFIFHYPFPNYVGAIFYFLGVSFVDSFKLVLASGYMLAALACFLWLKKIFSPFAATVGAVVFSTIPYWFVDIYVRGSVGEVWAIAWFFITLAAIEYKNALIISLAAALLVLSHNIMAMLLIPTIIFYLFIRNRSQWWTVLAGLLLSAYFWLPALAERGYMTGLNSVNYKDHFPLLAQLLIPSWGTGFSVRELTSDEMSYQIGVVPLVIFLLAFLTAKSHRPLRALAWLFCFLGITGLFLMLEASTPVWEAFGVLQLLQYPWRLLVFVLPATAFFTAWVVSKAHRWAAGVLCVAALAFSLPYMRPVVYAPRTDNYYLTRPEFTDGTSSLGNTFSTVWTGWKQIRPKEKIQVVSGEAGISELHLRPLRYSFQVDAPVASAIVVNTLYYPGWTVKVDGTHVPIDYQKEGIIEFSLEPGTHHVEVRFEKTPIRIFANALSVIGLAILAILGYTSKKYAHRHKHDAHVRRAQPAGHRPLHKRAYKRVG